MPRHERIGMTLFEVMAALAVAGLVLAGSRLLLDQLEDSGIRMEHARSDNARESNGRRVLAQLLSNAQSSIDTTDRFSGSSRSMTFPTECDVPAGWMEPCDAQIAIDSIGDSSVVFADLSTGEHLVLQRTSGHEQLRFGDVSRATEEWLASWPRAATSPAAVALVGSVDTIVFDVGAPHG